MSLKLYIEPYNDNNWTERLVKLIPHIETTFEDAQLIVSSKLPYSCINPSIIQDTLLSYKDYKKKVVIFLISDYNEPFEIPSNVLFFRTGFYKSQKRPNEFLLPHIWTEDGLKEFVFSSLPKRTIQPIVGFCGSVISHPCRVQHINKLKLAPDIKKNFILRTDYWGGKPHNTEVISDFAQNIRDTHFTLCSRGTGNWSARFYQTLFLGRIPIVVNTDLLLPFEDRIDWNDIIVLCQTENDLAKNIKTFWNSKEIIQAQKKCKAIYDNYLAPAKWCEIITNEILLPFSNS